MQKLKLVAALTLALASSASFAQANSAGFYGIGQFGSTTVKGTETYPSDPSFSQSQESSGNAWSLGLGYDFNQNLAFEVSYGSAWKQENTKSASTGYVSSNKGNVTAWNFSALGKLPVTQNVTLLAGPTYSHLTIKSEYTYVDGNYSDSNTEKQTKGLLGATIGASFALDKNTSLRATYTKYQTWKTTGTYSDGTVWNDETKLSNFMFGLAVKF